MPTSPDVRRLVAYVPAAHAQEIARRAALDGRTVSGWLARLIADTLGAEALDDGLAPADSAQDLHPHQDVGHPASPSDPEYAAWLRRNPGRR